MQEQVHLLLEYGIIEPSQSQFNLPLLYVVKKDGTPRILLDCRELNKRMIVPPINFPPLEDTLDLLAGMKYFGSFDLT